MMVMSTTAPSWLPRGRSLTRADLDALPDDGHRHELVDGTLVVTPAPSWGHQGALLELAVLLRAAVPPHLRVLFAPFDVAFDEGTVLQPDLLVARLDDLTERGLPAAPVLAVEVLSPSTRRLDATLKKSLYEAAGCHSFWLIDPDEPSITIWDLADGSYVESAHVVADQTHTVTEPFAVQLDPVALVR